MGDRGVAPVIDLAQRRRRGRAVGRGQQRRVLPHSRAPRVVWAVDWDAYGQLDRSEIAAVEKGTMRQPMVVKKLRRAGSVLVKRRMPLSRAQRRLAWRVERRASGVAWPDSRSARGELAPVVPIGHRGVLRRLGVRPVGSGMVAGNPLDDVA